MFDFILLKKKKLERHLFGSHQFYESWLCIFWLSLFFVGMGFGPWWAAIVLPTVFGLWLSVILSANFVRETRRFEWVDEAGIYLTPQPYLAGRFFNIVFKGLFVFFPLGLPISEFNIPGLSWVVKSIAGLIIFIWFVIYLIRSQEILWRMSLWRASLLVVTSVLTAILPIGVLGVMGFWSRQAADLSRWHVFFEVEFFVSSLVVIFGIPSLCFVIWQFAKFHLKGSRKPEGQRRRQLRLFPLRLSEIKLIVFLTLPWASWQGINDWNQRSLRQILYEGDIQGVIDGIHNIPGDLKVGIPYRADYYDLRRLIQFHDGLLARPSHLDHFSELSQAWWERHPQTKKVVSHLTVERVKAASYLSLAERLIVAHIRLDVNGTFTKFVRENRLVEEDVLAYLQDFKLQPTRF